MGVVAEAASGIFGAWETAITGPLAGPLVGSVLGGVSGAKTSAAGDSATDASLEQLAYQKNASQKINELINDPSKITSTGGYKSGMEAVERGLAARGYIGSGNEMTALADYGQNFYNQQIALLQSLASGMPSTVGAINTGTSVQSSGAGGLASIFSGLLGGGGGGGAGSLMGLLGGGGGGAAGFMTGGEAMGAGSWAASAGSADAVGESALMLAALA